MTSILAANRVGISGGGIRFAALRNMASLIAILVLCTAAGAVERPDDSTTPDPEELVVGSQGGIIRDAAGNALPNAVVRLCDPWLSRDADYRQERHVILATAETDERGAFQFRSVKCHPKRPGMEIPGWYVIVTAEGHGLAIGEPRSDADYDNLEVVLPAGRTISGRIVDDNGEPVAESLVKVRFIDSLTKIDPRRHGGALIPGGTLLEGWQPTAMSNAEGRFRIAGLPADKVIQLEILRTGFARKFALVATTDDAQPARPRNRLLGMGQDGRWEWDDMPVLTGDFTIALQRGWDLTGRVTLADTGAPCRHSRIMFNSYFAWTALTDDDGRFQISGLEFDRGTLTVHGREGGDYVSRARVLRFQRDSRQPEVEISLPRGVMVTGTVVDSDTGKPVSGVGVIDPVRAPGPEEEGADRLLAPRTGRTFAQGQFRIILPRGPRAIQLFGPVDGYSLPERFIVPAEAISAEMIQSVEVPDDDREIPPVRFSIARGIRVTGLVTDSEGSPVAEANVRLVDFYGQTVPHGSATTDGRGRFKLVRLLSLHGQRLFVTHEDRKLCGRWEFEQNPEPRKRSFLLGITLQPASRVVGRITGPNGPFSGARLELTEFQRDASGKPVNEKDVHTAIETDDTGQYTIDLLEPGREYRLTVSKPGFQLLPPGAQEFLLDREQTRELPDFVLRTIDKPGGRPGKR
jgi:hypothetical protein